MAPYVLWPFTPLLETITMGSLTNDSKTENGPLLGNITDVAVIGAGISGVVSTAHLLRAGFNVTAFERTGVVGGVWDYEPQADRAPPFPNVRPPVPNWSEVEKEGLSSDEVALIHAPPNPWYVSKHYAYNSLFYSYTTPILNTYRH